MRDEDRYCDHCDLAPTDPHCSTRGQPAKGTKGEHLCRPCWQYRYRTGQLPSARVLRRRVITTVERDLQRRAWPA